jgi:hypothetical protein
MDSCCDQVGDLVPKLVDDGLAGLRTNERRLQHPVENNPLNPNRQPKLTETVI